MIKIIYVKKIIVNHRFLSYSSLRIILNIAHVRDEARHLVQRDLVNVVSAHGVYAVGVPVYYVLIVEEELVSLHQLGLALRDLVRLHLVLEDVIELQVVVTDGLPAEHDHGVRVHHVKADEPDLLLSHDMDDLPRTPLRIELLDRRPVRKRFVADRVDVALGERAAVRAAYSLGELRERLLPLGLDVEGLALAEVVAF